MHPLLLFLPLVARKALSLVNGAESEIAVVAGAAVLALLERGMGYLGCSVLLAEQARMAVLAGVALPGVLPPIEQNRSLAASGSGYGLIGPHCRGIPRCDDQRERTEGHPSSENMTQIISSRYLGVITYNEKPARSGRK
jgi:hypothetical protein